MRESQLRRMPLVGVALAWAAIAIGWPAYAQTAFQDARTRALLVQSWAWGATWWESDGRGPRSVRLQLDAARLYGLAELTHVQSTVHRVGSTVSWSLSAGTLGYAAFRQTSLALGTFFSSRSPKAIPAGGGIRAAYFHLSPRGYPAAALTRLDLVWSTRPHSNLALTAGALGLLSTRGARGYGPGRTTTAGVIFKISERAFLAGEYTKEEAFPGSARAGISWEPATNTWLRFGAANEPARLAGGLGLTRGAAAVDVALERHYALGITSSISLAVRL